MNFSREIAANKSDFLCTSILSFWTFELQLRTCLRYKLSFRDGVSTIGFSNTQYPLWFHISKCCQHVSKNAMANSKVDIYFYANMLAAMPQMPKNKYLLYGSSTSFGNKILKICQIERSSLLIYLWNVIFLLFVYEIGFLHVHS